MTSHMKAVHFGIRRKDQIGVQAKCPECPKILKSKEYLKDHIKVVHKKSGESTCKYCQKVFSSKRNLALHIKGVHQGISLRSERKERKERKESAGCQE